MTISCKLGNGKRMLFFWTLFNWPRAIQNVKYNVGNRQHPKYYVVVYLIKNKRNEICNLIVGLACGTCKTWQSARE